MARWLLKEEPTHYAYDDLVRDGGTKWTGVHNALALANLRRMTEGDLALYYHTGSERACVGIVRVVSAPRADPTDPRGSWWVTVRPVRRLRRSIALAELRDDPALVGLDLLRIPRLSVGAITDPQWAALLAHERTTSEAVAHATGATKGRGRGAGRRRERTVARRRR